MLIVPMAAVLPQTAEFNSAIPGAWGFGVLDRNGTPIDQARHERGGRVLTSEELLRSRLKSETGLGRLHGRWFFGGLLNPHFGHFLSESVHRLVDVVDRFDRCDGVLFLKSPLEGSFDYDPLDLDHVRETLTRLFGIDACRIRFCGEPTEVEELMVVEQHHQLGVAAPPKYRQRLRALSDGYRATVQPVGKIPDSSLFVSRRRYLEKGRMLGVSSIESVLEGNGFTVVEPERYPMVDQIHMICRADRLVFEAGSAVHLLDLVGSVDAEVAVLSRRGSDRNYWATHLAGAAPSIRIFDAVVPVHEYLRRPAVTGQSLAHPQMLAGFLRSLDLVFDEASFVAGLSDAAFEDMDRLGLRLPPPTHRQEARRSVSP